MTLDLSEISLVNVANNTIHRMKAAIEEKGHLVEFYSTSPMANIQADERACIHIVSNILSNSIKFTANCGNIKLKIAPHNDCIALSISDNGIGIPNHLLDKVINPFEQADNRYARTYGGTGLGLAIATGLVKLHRGRIAIESEVGKGTTVTVYFPAAPDYNNKSSDADIWRQ